MAASNEAARRVTPAVRSTPTPPPHPLRAGQAGMRTGIAVIPWMKFE